MKTKLKKYIKEILGFIIILFIASNAVSYFKSTDLNKEPLQEKTFTLLDDSKYIVQDKPLLIYVWATWCPVCKFQSPNIQSLSDDYQVLTIAVQSGNEYAIEEYLQKEEYNFKVINDESGRLASSFNVNVYPTTFIYDKKHTLKFTDIGYTSTLSLYLKMFLANL